MKTVLFSAVRNEGPYLLEWVAYHRAIGFEEIYIGSNQNTDGSDELLESMVSAGYLDGHFAHVPQPGQNPQRSALEAFRAMGRLKDGDWFLFLDADEYLNIHLGEGRISDLMADIADRQGVQIMWKIFGAAGNTGLCTRYIAGTFNRCNTMDQVFHNGSMGSQFRQIKMMFRYKKGRIDLPNLGHRPFIAPNADLALDDFYSTDPDSPNLDNSNFERSWLAGEDVERAYQVKPSRNGWARAQINHYAVRTPEAFAMKRTRGRGASAGENQRHNDRYYQIFNRNEGRDDSVLRWSASTDTMISAMLENPTINGAYRQVIAATIVAMGENTNFEKPFSEKPIKDIVMTTKNSTKPAVDAAINLAKMGEDELLLPEIHMADASATRLREEYQKASAILEYGSGGSTVFAAGLGGKSVYAVESDAKWATKLNASIKTEFPGQDIIVKHVDIGNTGAWGRPANNKRFRNWPNYCLSAWKREGFVHPDVVLIDGRFRAGCFYATLLSITKPVICLFDDYAGRPRYHIVEELVKPAAMFDRMAYFELEPTTLNPRDLLTVTRAFYDPE